MRILIIEDDSLFAEILQTFIEEKNCSTIVAENLASAKQQLASSVFHFVLLDNHLPDGDGISFIEVVKATSSVPVPVMMITGDDNQIIMYEALERGADDFLMKPLSLDLLWQKILRVHSYYEKEHKLALQAKSLEALLNKQEREEQLARYVYEHVASKIQGDTDCVDTYIQSSSSFNGDVFICESSPTGNLFVILADATGHGLSAAISILPLLTTLRAMIRKGLTLPHIVHEANTKLCKELPDDKFVALIGVEINFHQKNLLLFNGGMPDVISIKHDKSLERIRSTSMALGIIEPEDFDPNIITLETHPIKNLFFFSDGLIEQQNLFNEEFGMARVMEILEKRNNNEPLVSRVVNFFTVFNEMNELQDDLSICDINVDALIDKYTYDVKPNRVKKSGNIIASFELSGGLIAETDLIGIFDGLMRSIDVVGDLRQKAFTVFAELISNALDHGILGLDSKLKNDFSGFADYLALKEKRLANMKSDDKLNMTFSFDPNTEEMAFSIKDSGEGYELKSTSVMDDTKLSGRGLALINKLCKQIDVHPPGNSTSVILKRDI